MSIALQGQIGELSLTVQVVRKETGKVEEYQLTGFLDEDQLKALQAQSDSNPEGAEQ